ncbi:MAG TPA: VWA domain-containing protein, partial [Armatimonadota bacterium]|nr:VWA domain-containing protein [Armatimonadota bacterium]
WEQALQDLQANAPLQKLRKNLLLLLQLVILLFAVFALTRPAMQWRQGGGRSVMLVIDVSASMRSTDVAPSRFEVARREAQRAVEALGHRDRMMLVAVGGGTRPLTTFTNDKRQLREALNALTVTDTRADLRGAFDLAVGMARNRRGAGGAELFILSDGAVPPVQLPADFAMPVQYQKIGRRCDNVGIVMMSVRRRVSRDGGFEGLIGLKNFSPSTKVLTLELSLNDRLLDARELTLAGNSQRTEVLSELPANAGILRAHLDVRDDLAVDNDAAILLPRLDPVSVTLASTGNLFLETALGLDPTLTVRERSTVPASLPAGDVLFADMLPLNAPPAGVSVLLVGAGGAAVPGTIEKTVDNPQVVDWHRRHPVLSYVNLTGVRIAQAQVIQPAAGAEVLIESDAGPIAVAQDKGGQRLIYLGFDLHRSDFPLTIGFPIFVGNCVDWLSGQRQRAQAVNVRTGDLVPVPVPPHVKTLRLETPDQRRVDLHVTSGTVTLDRVTQAGVYRLTAKEDKHFALQLTANLLDGAESNLTPKNIITQAGADKPVEVASRGMVKAEQ